MFPDAKKVRKVSDRGYSDTRQMAAASSMSGGDNFPWDRRRERGGEGERGECKGSLVLRELVTHLLCAPGASQRSPIIASIYPLACVL